MLKVKINGLALDATTNSPVVILAPEAAEPEGTEKGKEKILPIWIGHYEAWAIAMELGGLSSKRPLTHDLMKSVIQTMGGKVQKVEVTELVNQTFYAKVYVELNGKVLNIDARPSDSIALALKTGAPIYVAEELFQIHKSDTAPPEFKDPESLRERLRRINPEDFGKYTLGGP